jgi:hypothetical protein
MPDISVNLLSTSTILFQWQELIGSTLGIFGTLFVGLVGFISNIWYQKHKQMREDLRQTEIALALGINDIYDVEKFLKEFIERLETIIIKPLQDNIDPDNFNVSVTNFPVCSIYIEKTLLKAHYKSYYTHNKILSIYKVVEAMNLTLSELKIGYEKIFEMNKFLILNGSNPQNQRSQYLINNENFRSAVTEIIEHLQSSKREFASIKIYNLKFLTKKFFDIWKHEGISFKFFFNNEQIVNYRGKLESIERIDSEIKDEIDKALAQAEERLALI